MSDRAEAQVAPRVLFVVPGHQAGHDGITDYTFWLAAAAGRAGADCLIFALYPFDNDQTGYSSRFPKSGPGSLSFKLAQDGSLSERLDQLSAARQEFKPDWISVQFTPGSFRAGRFFLPGLLSLAKALGHEIPISLTVHENARVLNSDKSWRYRILARFRHFEIETGLRKLRPTKVFSSNPQYLADLSQSGFEPQPLPIISNIPRCPVSKPLTDPRFPSNARIALFFGRISTDWDPHPALSALCQENKKSSHPIIIVSIGVVGHRGLGWNRVTETAKTLGLPAFHLGTLSPEEISAWIQQAEFGLTPTPFSMWQKSSTCASMLAHDLPLIFSDDIPNSGQSLPARFATIQSGTLHWTTTPPEHRATHPTFDDLWIMMGLS